MTAPVAAVLLSACVTPQVSGRLTLVDPDARRRDYQSALLQWIALTERSGVRIVLAENSGERLESWTLPPGAARRVDLVAVTPPPAAAAARGKGAAEALLVDEALARVAQALPEGLIFKCTGRLAVRNWERIRSGLVEGTAVVADLPRSGAPDWIDSRFFGADRTTWLTELQGFAEVIDDEEDVVYEHVLARSALRVAERGGRVRSFIEQPWIEGRSGTSGRTYSRSAIKRFVRPALAWAGRRRRRVVSL